MTANKTIEQQIAELNALSAQLLEKDLSDSEYWLIKGEMDTAKKALEIIKSLQAELKVRDESLTIAYMSGNADKNDEVRQLNKKLEMATKALNDLSDEMLGEYADRIIDKALNQINSSNDK